MFWPDVLIGYNRYPMQRHTRPLIRPLLLVAMLVLGSLHAQTLFACDMMDTIVHDTCCCDEHERCVRSDCGAVLENERDPCCEASVGLSIEHASDQTDPLNGPSKVRFDLDPAPPVLATSGVDAHPYRIVTVYYPRAARRDRPPGSQIYLVTQRLRI